MTQEYITDFMGKKLGIIETDSNGDQRALDFNTRRILGYYKAAHNHTTDVMGRIVAKGNCVVSFIYNNK